VTSSTVQEYWLLHEAHPQLSQVKGEREPPLIEATIGAMLDRAVELWPDAEALVSVHQGISWTWTEFARRVDRLAAGLLALGLERGDRVGIWAPNCAEWTLVQFATARVGLIQVNINPAYRTYELEQALNKAGVKMLIAAERFKSSDYVAMTEGVADRVPSLLLLAKIGGVARPGWIEFDIIDAEPDNRLGAGVSPEQPVNIQFTSGTTGSPKGATLSHRNLVNNAFFVGRATGFRPGDRLCIPVPLYHCFGMVMANLACVIHGATMVYPSEGFDPLAALQAVASEKCTQIYGVPTMFIAELEHPRFDRFDLSSLRGGIMAGAPCPIEVMRKVVDRMHLGEVTIAYGMTETSPVSFQSETDEPMERRVTTVGRIQPHMEAKVVDPDGKVVPRGRSGELCTRGYAVMLGYWDDPARTAEAIDADGWMHTGDLATIDEQGYCNIVGRAKDMIIRGGENIYPREIEEFLFLHPDVEDVTVVGVPDPKYGEEICAWIRRRDGSTLDADGVVDFCAGRIAHFKVPRHIRFVDAFPITVTGKIQKFKIREEMIELLGVTVQESA
jgi:fatty-acyl-CoA synthase